MEEEEEARPVPTADSNQEAPVLPPEVITEILARLPAKSVGRFRCVSRAWCAMLSTAYFVDLHLRCANRPDHPRLLLTAVGSGYDGHLHSWRPGGAVEKLKPDDFSDGVIVPVTKPCRGLILVRGAGYCGYFVCNPSTGFISSLPQLAWDKRPSCCCCVCEWRQFFFVTCKMG
ncbi:F-box protein At3g49450-like isoform X3 [Panicum hallii]|uniref:F-box protein At3g49450-like isoform X3 n=1 Tax=Panicum hallii TaxID=206008 RepID=UPI000DF4CDDA|nr:F-box protein At3g49450-like isoform X3 [Panicum hallii]